MKKTLVLIVLMMMTLPANAYVLQQNQIARMASQTSNGKQVKVYNQYGSLDGYVKPIGKNQYATYDKYHSRNGRFEVSNDGSRVKIYSRAGH